MGAGPASFFYDKNKTTGITYIQTAIRDTPRDAVLIIKCDNGNVSFEGCSLTGEKLQPVESYNVNFWSENSAPEAAFNYRLLPYLSWLVITHHYFWIGVITGIIIIVVIRWLISKWKIKK
jgi:hypothetical protein